MMGVLVVVRLRSVESWVGDRGYEGSVVGGGVTRSKGEGNLMSKPGWGLDGLRGYGWGR